jgi:hypothetical protein
VATCANAMSSRLIRLMVSQGVEWVSEAATMVKRHELVNHGLLGCRTAALNVTNVAAVLVVALVAHLALMASPLHAMDPDSAIMVTAEMEPDGVMSMPTPVACMGSSDDCSAEWTTPPSGWSIQSVVSPPPALGARPLLDQVPGRAFDPHALGPPRSPDVQALLQVFRI